eukprot:GHRQ01036784.1.p1 GENE.GHRQ01036784.1~~GHRQ01036784.1.p1  ORF type:complete len:120 (+),score=8.80 GHRQ01036784.1:23-361(+)
MVQPSSGSTAYSKRSWQRRQGTQLKAAAALSMEYHHAEWTTAPQMPSRSKMLVPSICQYVATSLAKISGSVAEPSTAFSVNSLLVWRAPSKRVQSALGHQCRQLPAQAGSGL